MAGDITRDTFNPKQRYTAVRAQQGRVMLDADVNEHGDILRHDTRAGRREILGPAAAPLDAPGFGVTVVGGVPTLSPGRFALDGLLLENPDDVRLDAAQPFMPTGTVPEDDGEWLAYLEASEHPVTAVEAPQIREVALGGPDTTTRDQLVWQVRFLRLGSAGTGSTCTDAENALERLAEVFDGVLTPQLQAGTSSGPCIVSEAAGFRGLENQLYRIEVHSGTVDANGIALTPPPTFVWSRDNGARVGTAVSLVSASPIRLQVDRLGPGGAEGFDRGATLEIDSADLRLAGAPGLLATVEDVAGDVLTLTLDGGTPVAELQTVLAGSGVIVRRWDSNGAQEITTGSFLRIEDGLEVRFDGGGLRTGDHWLIPARTTNVSGGTTQLDWPVSGGAFNARRSSGPARHRAPLAILTRAGGTWTANRDCRAFFPSLSETISLSAEGDGQSAARGAWLPSPLRVRAMRGQTPAAGVPLRFVVMSGGGRITPNSPDSGGSLRTTVDAVTDENGIAEVFHRLGTRQMRAKDADDLFEPETLARVDAIILGRDDEETGQRVSFAAEIAPRRTLAIAGGNGQHGRPGERLEVALRVAVHEGGRPVGGAVVTFKIMNQILDGTPLNQNSGGNLLASALQVSGVAWDGGSAFHTVSTRTNRDGIAQVQWTLGTNRALATQRVEAQLEGFAPSFPVLFTAQLAIAQETTWQPEVPWLAGTVGAANRNLQATTDAIARRVEEIAQGGPSFDPFIDLQWRNTNNVLSVLEPTSVVPLDQFAALSFRGDLVPPGRDEKVLHAHGGIALYPEVPDAAGLARVMRMSGNIRRASTASRWEWTMSSDARKSLSEALGSSFQQFRVRIVVVPRWLPGGQSGDASMAYESALSMSSGRFLIAPIFNGPIVFER